MTQAAATLTQPDIARLMGTLGYTNVRAMILAFGQEVGAGRLRWAPGLGGARDTFGPSLALQARQGSTLTRPQVNAARTGLLQRNWEGVRDLLTRDVVVVPDAVLDRVRQSPRRAPARRPQRIRRRRSAAPQPVAPAPAPVAAPTLCGRQLAFSNLRCTELRGHNGGCMGDAPRQIRQPTNGVDSVLAAYRSGMSVSATITRSVSEPVDADDAQARRFRLVIEAAWDDIPVDTYREPEIDPSVERFRLLDLD